MSALSQTLTLIKDEWLQFAKLQPFIAIITP